MLLNLWLNTKFCYQNRLMVLTKLIIYASKGLDYLLDALGNVSSQFLARDLDLKLYDLVANDARSGIYINNRIRSINHFLTIEGGIILMDWRLLIVLLPLLVAGGWAFFQIGAIAIKQAQKFLNKEA